MTLKKGFYARPAELPDLQGITELFNNYWEPLLGMPKVSIDDIQNSFTAPGFDMKSSTLLVLTADELMVGCILVIDYISPPVRPLVQGCVHNDFQGQGIGEYLLTWAEQRASYAICKVPTGFRVAMQLHTLDLHNPTIGLFEKMKILPVRHSYLMVAKLDNNLDEPVFPDGIRITTYRDYPDLRAIYRAANEAFQDHWGYVEGEEEESIRIWHHHNENNPDFDPSLWFIAMDKSEIAAVALCSPNTGSDREMGFVLNLSVRRPWRRRGLALAMLRYVFREFYYRGLNWAGLTVDAESLTGANRVYTRAGMKVVRDIVTYEKELRPGKEMPA